MKATIFSPSSDSQETKGEIDHSYIRKAAVPTKTKFLPLSLLRHPGFVCRVTFNP